ncbi:hypothetical protein [Microtetraspora malaysiensis]|uniref:hypothetical protein n=1 Tax=Microtetraspora malaysiensis TaxID=161358 RepID=UPI003D932F18
MTDVLVGQGCVGASEAGAVRIRYEQQRKVPRPPREPGELPSTGLIGDAELQEKKAKPPARR